MSFIFGQQNNSASDNVERLNNQTNKILTRFNLNQLNLKSLNVNYVKSLKNPNKNSCLLTKLEILEKIFQANGMKNAKISAYINELKGPKRENIEPSQSNQLRESISNKIDKLAYWESDTGLKMKGRITGNIIKRQNNTLGIKINKVSGKQKNKSIFEQQDKNFSKLEKNITITNKNFNNISRNNFNSYY